MTVQVWVNEAQVQFVRDRRDAKVLKCPEVLTLPLGQVAGAWLIEDDQGGAHLRVLPRGGDTSVAPDRDPFSAYFDAPTLPSARYLLERLEKELAADPATRPPAMAAPAPVDKTWKSIDRLATVGLWAEGFSLALGLIALVLFLIVGVAVMVAVL